MGYIFQYTDYYDKNYNRKSKIDWSLTFLMWMCYGLVVAMLSICVAIGYKCVYKGQCSDKDTFYSQCQQYNAVVQCGKINEDELEGCKFRSVLVGKVMQRQCCKCVSEE